MKIQKIMVAFVAVIIMATAMIGLATATGFDIVPSEFTITDGGEAYVTVTWTGGEQMVALWDIQKWDGASYWTLTTEVNAQSDTGAEPDTSGEESFAGGESHVYTLTDVGGEASEVGDIYRIEFVNKAGYPVLYSGVGDFSVSAYGDIDIPEFATIAIPAAAIIGLFLFFNHRKRKKE